MSIAIARANLGVIVSTALRRAGVSASRRTRESAVPILSLLLVVGLAFTPQAEAQWAGGPVLIGGDETDNRVLDAPQAGKIYAAEAFDFLGREVTNGKVRVHGILPKMSSH